ncbi:MAG: hypothetical protein JNK10_11560 [Cyclobacteriaceae bacterium]|nr:hypothetical protein [Cyclobacteriaceae bacterium]
MKKVIALVMVCGFALAFASCGGGGSTTESTATDTTAVAADSTAAPADTTKTDSTKMN